MKPHCPNTKCIFVMGQHKYPPLRRPDICLQFVQKHRSSCNWNIYVVKCQNTSHERQACLTKFSTQFHFLVSVQAISTYGYLLKRDTCDVKNCNVLIYIYIYIFRDISNTSCICKTCQLQSRATFRFLETSSYYSNCCVNLQSN